MGLPPWDSRLKYMIYYKAYIMENIGKGYISGTSNFFPTVRPPSRLLTASR
jgi:hypothetical protein